MNLTKSIYILVVVTTICFLAAADETEMFEASGDECFPDLCMNGGRCDENEPACVCIGRWNGTFCNESIVCENEPCNEGECFSDSDDVDGFVCNCTASFGGTTCNIPVCEETVREIDNETAYFASALEGESQSSNITCVDGEFEGLPVASLRCGSNFTWGELLMINCSASFASLNTSQKIENILVTTSNPDAITPDVVSNTLDTTMEVVESESITEEEANSLMAATSNLLNSTNDDARDAIQNNSPQFLDNWRKVGRIIFDDINGLYENVESEIAMVVPTSGNAVLPTPAAQMLSTRESSYSFIQAVVLNQGDKFAAADFELSTDDVTDAALYVTVESDNGAIFQAFHDNDLLFDQTSTDVESVVMSIHTTEETTNFEMLEMKFYLFEYYDMLEDTNYNPETVQNKTFFCSNWDAMTKAWKENGQCSVEAISKANLYNYVTCTCNQTGYFTITSRVVPEDDGNGNGNGNGNTNEPVTGLDGGEIAGIVIGSIVGALLLFGLIFYFVKKNKSKKVSTGKTSAARHSVVNSSSDEEMELGHRQSSNSYTNGNKL